MNYKKLLVFGIAIIFLLGSVSAFSFNSKKELKINSEFQLGTKTIKYNKLWEKYSPIEIKNLFGKVKFKGAITKHTDECSSDCSSTIELESDGGVLIEDIRFKQLEDEIWIDLEFNNYQLYIQNGLKQSKRYENDFNCHGFYNNGTEKCYSSLKLIKYSEPNMILYDIGDEVNEGNLLLEVTGDKPRKSIIDFQIKIDGRWINEWAQWGSLSVNTTDAHGVAVATSSSPYDAQDQGVQINLSSKNMILNNITIAALDSSDTCYLLWANETVILTGINRVGNACYFPQYIMTANNDYRIYMDGNSGTGIRYQTGEIVSFPIVETNFNWSAGRNPAIGTDSNSIWGIISIGYSVTTSEGSISLNTPTNGAIAKSPVTINCSAEQVGVNLTNITLISNFTGTWTENETVDVTWLANSTTFSKSLPEGVYNWSCHACDEDGDCGYATENRTLVISQITINNIIYEAFVSETSNEQFNASLEYKSADWNSITAKMEYDGINYTGIQHGTGDSLTFARTIGIPAITGTSENKTFSWHFSLTNATGSFGYESADYQQNISAITLKLCEGGENPYVRFFTKDAENPFPEVNATFKSAWNIGTVGGSGLLANHSYEDLTELNNTWEFCITPNNTNYSLTVDVEVDASEFAKNFYFIQNETYLSGETTNITLYLLNDSAATPTTLRTRNTAQNRLANVLVYIDVFDIGTNDYYTVGMAKTNENGEDVSYLNWYDTLYRFRLFQNGVETLRTNNTKIFDTPKIFEIGEDFTYSFDKFANIVHTLTYDNATSIFALIFETNDASIEEGCLRVIKRNPANDTDICLTCVESESATITCDVSTYGNGTYIAAFYATGSFSLVDLLSIEKGQSFAEQIFGLLDKDDAAFYSIILALITVAMFLITPVLGIIGALIGLTLVASLGFATISYAYFMGIVILGIGVIWSLKK